MQAVDDNEDFLELLRSLGDDSMANMEDDNSSCTASSDASADELINTCQSRPEIMMNIIPKRKRIRKSRSSAIPRIVKNDIRNHYSSMFAIIFNSMDCNLIDSFFSTFCHPSLCLSVSSDLDAKCHGQELIKNNEARLFQVHGSAFASQFSNNNALLYPDMTIQLCDTKLHRSADSDECRLVSTISASATKIYDSSVWSDELHYVEDATMLSDTAVCSRIISPSQKRMRVDTSFQVGNSAPMYSNNGSELQQQQQQQVFVLEGESFDGKRGYQLCYTSKEQQELISRTPLMSKPVTYTVTGTMTLVLDANKRITELNLNTILTGFNHVTD